MAKKILVVDDEQEIVFLIKRRLIKAGYDVIFAHDGPTALALAKKEKPDLMILDIMIPAPTGLEICRTLKQDAQYSAIKIVLLSARDQQQDKDIGMQAGADLYMTKPFETEELIKNAQVLLGE